MLLDFVITKKSQLMDDSKTSMTVTTTTTASTLTMINTTAVFYHQGRKTDSKNTISIRMYSNL